jgi:hypothetical protein
VTHLDGIAIDLQDASEAAGYRKLADRRDVRLAFCYVLPGSTPSKKISGAEALRSAERPDTRKAAP